MCRRLGWHTLCVSADSFRGPTSLAIEGWVVLFQRDLPAMFDEYKSNASVVECHDLGSGEGDVFFAAVARQNAWPSLVIAQRFTPCQGGFDPGVALVPATQTVFLGAGTRLVAYRLDDPPVRLWEDSAECGFWHWSVHPEAVLMAAELQLAAWDLSGTKLWTRFVEPPWTYAVADGQVKLDVLGQVSEFSVVAGP